ncbi:glycoside hydrolase family 31 protein [Demequina sp. NBRC 110055]|uniref:glycoside hydrolase family 31 protein n=1 Tax=Demequina sp. NBRC 110055 TaxID=1570344 RepID=UPI000A064280|nr:glycoside hydrolase family 31 protein [Demequina sp. NBRC 110055]
MTLQPPATLTSAPATQPATEVTLALEPGERWWGGAVEDAHALPYGGRRFTRDLAAPHASSALLEEGKPSNQAAPLLVSTTGRIVWSPRPFSFTFADGTLNARGHELVSERAGSTLGEAFRAASARYFPASGSTPARELFTAPQYNTWIEQPYHPTQASVLAYAQRILDAGMRPGTLFIDDCWSPDYGTWHFDPARFPDPAEMTRILHRQGFHVMLWVVPFVSPDSAAFRSLESEGLLVREASGRTAVRRWWNGLSAVLDLSHPRARTWMTDQLDRLVHDVGIDGFKFDGGDIRDFRADDLTAAGAQPVDQCEAWASLGSRYPFNEYRASWKSGGQPLAQRLQDKPPLWGPEGIGALIPEMLAQGMIGHPYVCPDMIGGGEITSMSTQTEIDQEFFVRYAQVAAMAPMAQFSVLPFRVLDARHLAAVEAALALRESLMPLISQLLDNAALTGEPMLRPMEYHATGMADVTDQYFLGPDLIVAPVIEPGARTRVVHLPDGQWRGLDGTAYEGPCTVTADVTLDSIPRFARQ